MRMLTVCAGFLILTVGPAMAGNWCLEFDGQQDWVEILASPLEYGDPDLGFTCEGRVKVNQVSGNPDSDVIFYNGPIAEFSITVKDNHEMGFAMKFADIDWQEILAPIDWNEWFHFAVVYDRPGGKMRLFINGARQAELTLTSDNLHPWSTVGMGTYTPFLETNGYFNGWIDAVRVSQGAIYNVDFSPSVLFGMGPGTLALWDLEAGVGDYIEDSSPNDCDGIRHGPLWRETASAPVLEISWDILKRSF